jgi:hypothetical protein
MCERERQRERARGKGEREINYLKIAPRSKSCCVLPGNTYWKGRLVLLTSLLR